MKQVKILKPEATVAPKYVNSNDICLAVSKDGKSIYHLCQAYVVHEDRVFGKYTFVSLSRSDCWAAGSHKTVESAIKAVLGVCDVYVFDSVLEMATFIVERKA